MGTTTNNGWTYPESTDLVKDGATAIETLATDIDTTLGVYAPSTSGLELINTTSFSGVSSQSVNDVFSATYDNYRIVLNVTNATTGNDITMRMRVSGSDNSSSNYVFSGIQNDSNTSTVFGYNSGGLTTAFNIAGSSTGRGAASFDLFQPFATQRTGMVGSYHNMDTGNRNYFYTYGGAMSVTTSYTGFTILCASNIGGTISVYGLAK
jgi:hypothetical protein